MTETNNENNSFKDQYHWVSPDIQTTGVLKTAIPSNRVEVTGYDCTQPRISPSPQPK